MRADRDAGTEKSAVQVSTCAGTCRPQSRFSHASIVGIVERRKMVVQPPGKKVANRREKSGYNMVDTISACARMNDKDIRLQGIIHVGLSEGCLRKRIENARGEIVLIQSSESGLREACQPGLGVTCWEL